MSKHELACPSCSKLLAFPPGSAGRAARCPVCRHKFRIPAFDADGVSEDDIANWLFDEEEPAAGAPVPPPVPAEEKSEGGTATKTQTRKTARTVAEGPIRVVRADEEGVLLEFPAARLRDPMFRLAMPRRCVSCGTSAHLAPRVVLYLAQSLSVSPEAEHKAGTLSLREDEIKGLSDEALLEALPRVPNVPSPADLPMPYWLCDMCSPAALVKGQIEMDTTSGKGRCRLLIQPVRRAEEFYLAAGGAANAEDQEKIQALIERCDEHPWDRLPSVVRQRIQQWFTPAKGEEFVAYIPDRDHTRTEDGVYGLLVSTKRLVCHTQMRHREAPLEQPVELRLAMGRRNGHLRIDAGDWTVKRLTIDRDGVRRLRRSLTVCKSRAVWR